MTPAISLDDRLSCAVRYQFRYQLTHVIDVAGVPRYRALFEETRGGLEMLGVVFLIVGNGIGLLRPGSL